MSKALRGTIKIIRSGAHATIEVRDDLSREVFLTIEIFDGFLTRGMMEGVPYACDFVPDHLEHVGLCYQERILHIQRPCEDPSDAEWEEAMSEFERHDWKGELADCGNPQRTVTGGAQAVRFFRYVKTEDIRPCPIP